VGIVRKRHRSWQCAREPMGTVGNEKGPQFGATPRTIRGLAQTGDCLACSALISLTKTSARMLAMASRIWWSGHEHRGLWSVPMPNGPRE
jgi:hypothetical protein